MENSNVMEEVFSFEGKKGTDAVEISHDLLSKSINRQPGLAGIRNVPKQYWTALMLIYGILDQQEINYTKGKIFVQNNSSKAYLTDTEKESGFDQKNAPINRWRFDKAISKISLPNIVSDPTNDQKARNAALGIVLNKEGLSVAFGMNVWVCRNFNVMGGTLINSYGNGREGLPWDVMFERIKNWVGQLDQIWKVQNEIKADMEAYVLSNNDQAIDKVIGSLYVDAIKQAYFKGKDVPFNTYELSEFVQQAIHQGMNEAEMTNVWDLYNWGTSIMKPGKYDLGEITENSNTWANYLIDYFNLNSPKEIINIEN